MGNAIRDNGLSPDTDTPDTCWKRPSLKDEMRRPSAVARIESDSVPAEADSKKIEADSTLTEADSAPATFDSMATTFDSTPATSNSTQPA